MPFARASLAELRQRIRAEITSRFPGADTTLRHNNLRVTADVIAGASNEDLAYLDWQFRQVFPDTAESSYLERWAAIWGVSRKGAVRATGNVTITGVAGAAVPLGVRLRRGDEVEIEITAAGVVGGGGTVTLAASAVVGGDAGETDAGTALIFVTTPSGLADQAVVAAGGMAGGADVEPDASLLRRTLLRIQEPPHGGNDADWRQWCLAVPGVTRVWVRPASPMAGSVTIYPMFDDLRAGQNGIPQGTDAISRPNIALSGSGDQRFVLDALLPLRPVTASIFVKAAVPVPLNVTVTGLVNDTPTVRAAIATELADMIYRRAAEGASVSRSWVAEAVSRAAGEDRHTLAVPAGDVSILAGQIAVPGVLTVNP